MTIETPRQFRAFVRLIAYTALALLLLVIAFSSLPLIAGNNDAQLATFSTQQWVSQRVAKDALLMTGSPTQRAGAVNELQNELPLWEHNQAALKASFLPTDIAVLFSTSNVDWLDLDTAARAILAHPTAPADPVEVQIILDHERPYFVTDTQIVAILTARRGAQEIWLFGIETLLCFLIVAAIVVFLAITERLIARYLAHHAPPVP